jgi:hypothetical protein
MEFTVTRVSGPSILEKNINNNNNNNNKGP